MVDRPTDRPTDPLITFLFLFFPHITTFTAASSTSFTTVSSILPLQPLPQPRPLSPPHTSLFCYHPTLHPTSNIFHSFLRIAISFFLPHFNPPSQHLPLSPLYHNLSLSQSNPPPQFLPLSPLHSSLSLPHSTFHHNLFHSFPPAHQHLPSTVNPPPQFLPSSSSHRPLSSTFNPPSKIFHSFLFTPASFFHIQPFTQNLPLFPLHGSLFLPHSTFRHNLFHTLFCTAASSFLPQFNLPPQPLPHSSLHRSLFIPQSNPPKHSLHHH